MTSFAHEWAAPATEGPIIRPARSRRPRWRVEWLDPDGEPNAVNCSASIAKDIVEGLVGEGTPPDEIRLTRKEGGHEPVR